MRNAYAFRMPGASPVRIADTHCSDACAPAWLPHRPRPDANLQVNAPSMRNACGIDASASCSKVGERAGQTARYAPAYASVDASRARRTNEQYVRTYWSPRDPSLNLINACVRVHPGVVDE
jgi:hypothetical protein